MNVKILLSTIIISATLLCVHTCFAAGDAAYELQAGLKAMEAYNFKDARTHLAKYKDLVSKTNVQPDVRAENALAAIPIAEDMLAGQVEQLVIVDSITVPKQKFLEFYKLSAPSGTLTEAAHATRIDEGVSEQGIISASFESEDGSVRYVSVAGAGNQEDADIDDITHIYETVRLDDGTLTDPYMIFDEDVDAAFPFMMSDGCTFYFASRSEQGLGGYDIFRSYRDSETGEFRNPVNMGMPYNSPANDYMLAIDEYRGIGWWATDRNCATSDQGEDMVTIYTFIPSGVRKNYDADTPDIKQFAALWTLHYPDNAAIGDEDDIEGGSITDSHIPGYRLTWPEDADYSSLLSSIEQPDVDNVSSTADFRFYADNGKLYTRYDQLPAAVRPHMLRYHEALAALIQAENRESDLRENYSQLPADSLRNDIQTAAQLTEKLRTETRMKLNSLFKALRD